MTEQLMPIGSKAPVNHYGNDATTVAGSAVKSPRQTKSAHMQPGAKSETWELTKLQAVHHEILRLKLTGMKQVDIAAVLRVTPAMVGYTVNSSLGQRKLALMGSARDCDSINFTQKMKDLLPKVAELYENTLDDENADLGLRVKVATIVAKDFAGQAVPVETNNRHIHQYLSTDEITAIKKRGLEQARLAGMVIDVEPE